MSWNSGRHRRADRGFKVSSQPPPISISEKHTAPSLSHELRWMERCRAGMELQDLRSCCIPRGWIIADNAKIRSGRFSTVVAPKM